MLFVPKNQRSSMRHAVKLPCQVVRERDFQLVGDRTLDLSPEGMLLNTNLWGLKVGEKLLVSFRAPTDLDIWFDTEGTVARVERGRRPKDKGRAVGVNFSLSEIGKLIVRGNLRRVPPPLPRRETRIDYAATVAHLSSR